MLEWLEVEMLRLLRMCFFFGVFVIICLLSFYRWLSRFFVCRFRVLKLDWIYVPLSILNWLQMEMFLEIG